MPAIRWHPVLAAVEVEPGTWVMHAPDGRPYGVVRALEIGGERGYRAVTWHEDPARRELVGYYRTLFAATRAAHSVYLRGHGPAGFAPDPWPAPRPPPPARPAPAR